jgi:drug/metabolite transporter (DMT)-like permease
VIGLSVALAGIIVHAISLVLGREINRSTKYPPLVVTVISMGAGSSVLLLTGLGVEGIPAIDFKGWAIIFWLAGVNTAFAFTLMNHTLRTLTAMESSMINSTMLIWIPLLAVIFLGERLNFKEVVGLVLTGMGTLVVQLRHLPRARKGAAW